MYLLDTNVITELRRAGTGNADPAVETWLRAQLAIELHVSVITLFECELGARLLEHRDARQGQALRRSLAKVFLRTFGERILDVTPEIALRAVDLHVPDPAAERDSWIAATALVHGLTVVTRNVADFERTGVNLFDPWAAPAACR